jgi:hypothetical protein
MSYKFGNGTLKTYVHLTSSQLLSLHGTPITVIPAPGMGYFVHVLSVMAQYKYNTTAYTQGSGGDLALRYVGDTNDQAVVPFTGLLDQTANTVSQVFSVSPYLDAQTVIENIAIEAINNGTGEWTLGDDDVYLTILYELITLS